MRTSVKVRTEDAHQEENQCLSWPELFLWEDETGCQTPVADWEVRHFTGRQVMITKDGNHQCPTREGSWITADRPNWYSRLSFKIPSLSGNKEHNDIITNEKEHNLIYPMMTTKKLRKPYKWIGNQMGTWSDDRIGQDRTASFSFPTVYCLYHAVCVRDSFSILFSMHYNVQDLYKKLVRRPQINVIN